MNRKLCTYHLNKGTHKFYFCLDCRHDKDSCPNYAEAIQREYEEKTLKFDERREQCTPNVSES